MKIGDIKNTFLLLLHDALDAEGHLDGTGKSQFARRTYVRTVFAYIEGAVSILKDASFNAKTFNDKRTLTIAEYAILKEETYELKNNGEIRTTTKFLRLPDNLRYTISVVNKLFKANIDLKIGSNEWNKFLSSLDVRHRITHPKRITSFDISDKELQDCKDACHWFNDVVALAIESIVKAGADKVTLGNGAQ